MKIFHIDRQRSWTGQIARQYRVVTGLADRGYDVGVICSPGAAISSQARDAGIEVLELPMRGAAAYASIFRVARALRERRVDILHCHGPRDHFLGLFAGALARTPHVLRTKHNHTRLRSGAFSRLQYERSGHVVAISEYVRQQLIADGIAPDHVTTIPSAIDTKRFRPMERSLELARELGIEKGDIVVGNVSSLHRRKGIDTILRAFQILRSDPALSNLRLLLAGKSRERWAALAKELGVEDRVLLPGFREDVPEVLAQLDVYILPSRQEGLGTSIIEAMAMGLPIVASNVGGIVESVTPDAGILVEPDDPAAVARAVRELLADSARRRRLGERGRERAVRKFSVGSMLDATERLYRELARAAGA